MGSWLGLGQDVSDPSDQFTIPATAHVFKAQSPGFIGLIIWDNEAVFNAANFVDVPVGTVVITYLAGNAALSIKEDDGTWTTK